MKRITLIFLLLSFYSTGKTQKEPISSQTLSEKAEYHYQNSEYDTSYYFAKKHFDELQNSSNDTLIINSLIQLVKITENTHYDEQELFYQLAEEKAMGSDNMEKLIEINYIRGNNHYEKKNFVYAIPYFLKVDSLSKNLDIKNPTTIKAILNRAEISKLSFTRETTIMAQGLLDEALEDANVIGSIESINLVYIQLADIHQLIGDFPNAIKFIELAFNYYSKQENVKRVSRLYLIKTAYYLGVDSINMANQTHLDRIAYLSTTDNTFEKADAAYYYGNFLRNYLSDWEKAILYLEKAKKYYQEIKIEKFETYHRCIRDLAFCNFELGNYKQSSVYYKDAYDLKIELLEKFNRSSSKILEAKYQTEKKEKEIGLLKSQNALAEQQKKTQRYFLSGGIGIMAITGLFFFILYRNTQRTSKRLKELDRAKSNFFANISHEFRTPLTLIAGPIQKQLLKDDLTDEERISFEMMDRNSNRLISLVGELLDISKIETGSLKLKVSKNKILPFIGSLADGFTFSLAQHKINFASNISSHETISWFDKDVLEKIVINLLSNAIKYTPIKGSITCDAMIKNKQLHFEVKNTGEGIKNEDLKKVFERFYQVNEDKQGVGLGLALVKELVTLHKGSITVESKPNELTTFTVVIPIDKDHFNEHEMVFNTEFKAPENKSVLKETFIVNHNNDFDLIGDSLMNTDKPVLLIIDDNADIRSYLSDLFKNTFSIFEATNGQEGVEFAFEYIPDFIISDLMMPVKSGIELCNELKSDERTGHIPIFLLTAKAGEENEKEGIISGADAYITKPFNEELLILKVNKLLENRKKLQDRYNHEGFLNPKDIAANSMDELFLERVIAVLKDKLIESSFNTEVFGIAIGMSRMQLHRKLKALTGLSTSEFIRSQRLKLAVQTLRKANINISQVGYSVGFNDHAYFSKCFKETYHCTPSEYVNKQ